MNIILWMNQLQKWIIINKEHTDLKENVLFLYHLIRMNNKKVVENIRSIKIRKSICGLFEK